ncbi:MAG: hypothetical protein WBD63_07170 [Phycisphaerae bacterium]|nr:hypothetical protein [Phycisphaerae bacterium]
MAAIRRFQWLAVVGAVVAAVLVVQAWAADEESDDSKVPVLILRTYDISALLVPVENYPCTVRFLVGDVAGAEDAFNDILCGNARAAEVSGIGWAEHVDIIKRSVNSMADPAVAPWSDEGGPAAMDCLGNCLIITQTAAGHQKVEALLKGLEDKTNRAVMTVHGDWVEMDGSQAAALLDGASKSSPPEVTAAALEKAGAKVIYGVQLSCFSGQTVHVARSLVTTYVADVEIDEKSGDVSPVMGSIPTGLVFQVSPTLATDGKTATVDIRCQTVGMKARDFPLSIGKGAAEGTASSTANLELPECDEQKFRTTIRVPLDKQVIVAGAAAPQGDKTGVLYLVIKVTASK